VPELSKSELADTAETVAMRLAEAVYTDSSITMDDYAVVLADAKEDLLDAGLREAVEALEYYKQEEGRLGGPGIARGALAALLGEKR
jgi:hypothetical protein